MCGLVVGQVLKDGRRDRPAPPPLEGAVTRRLPARCPGCGRSSVGVSMDRCRLRPALPPLEGVVGLAETPDSRGSSPATLGADGTPSASGPAAGRRRSTRRGRTTALLSSEAASDRPVEGSGRVEGRPRGSWSDQSPSGPHGVCVVGSGGGETCGRTRVALCSVDADPARVHDTSCPVSRPQIVRSRAPAGSRGVRGARGPTRARAAPTVSASSARVGGETRGGTRVTLCSDADPAGVHDRRFREAVVGSPCGRGLRPGRRRPTCVGWVGTTHQYPRQSAPKAGVGTPRSDTTKTVASRRGTSPDATRRPSQAVCPPPRQRTRRPSQAVCPPPRHRTRPPLPRKSARPAPARLVLHLSPRGGP